MNVKLNSLSIGYFGKRGPIAIQRDINASVEEGQFVALLGPNGAGKSTLLRTLAGFMPALSGSVLIDGRNLAALSDEEISRSVGVVLTERPSVSSMTVEQLVALGRSPYTGFWGRLRDADRKIVEESLELTGCTEMRSRLVDTLSDGERQRVMVAKALAQRTPVILLDEPTAFLDFPSKVEMMRLLRSLAHERGLIVLQSTHDINMALSIADSLWMIDRNLGFAAGSPRELAALQTLQNYFLRPGIAFDSDSLSFTIG